MTIRAGPRVTDLGVRRARGGTALVFVAGPPGPGQYAFDGARYEFNGADRGATVELRFARAGAIWPVRCRAKRRVTVTELVAGYGTVVRS